MKTLIMKMMKKVEAERRVLKGRKRYPGTKLISLITLILISI